MKIMFNILNMYMKVVLFQREVLKIIHYYCIEGVIYNLKRIYSKY
jgi:hypothetical protein